MPGQFVHLQSSSFEKGKKRLQRFNSVTKRAKLFKDTEEQIDVLEYVGYDPEMSGVRELDHTAYAEMTEPPNDVLSPMRPSTVASSPVHTTAPQLTSTPVSGLRRPLVHRTQDDV